MSVRKSNKGWKKFAFDECKNDTNTEKNGFVLQRPVPNQNFKIFNFEHVICPKTVEDLAVHVKKINDIEFWLNNNVVSKLPEKKSPMLLITGPTGCGKTTTVKVLCNKLNIEVTEWINPIDKDKDYTMGQTAQLLEFLSESKYPSLLSINKPKVILIEDFPNSVIHNPSEFINVLEKCLCNKSSVIFICTDASTLSLNLEQTLFPQDIRDQYSIYSVSFNATSNTLLKKALKRAQTLLNDRLDVCNVVDQSVVDDIVSSSMGDIRCAVNQFYFACLKDLDSPLIIGLKPTLKAGNKRKRKDKSATKNKQLIKNERLSFFHGIGRVLNPKREEKNGTWRLQHDVNALVEELTLQPSTFNDFLHANYIKYFGSIEDICNAADVLSFAQRFLNRWENRDDMLKYGMWIPVMGLMVYNQHKVSKWNQIARPKKVTKTVNNDVELRSVNIVDRCYLNIINNKDFNNKFKL